MWRYKPVNQKKWVWISFLLFVITSLVSFFYVEVRLQPVLYEYAKTKVKQIASIGINTALSKKIVEGSDYRELFVLEKDEEGKIRAVAFNYNEYARIVSESTARVQNYFDDKEYFEVKVPLGQALDSNILATLGPNVPVTFVPIGSVFAEVQTETREVGINMVILTVFIRMEAEVKMVIPFSTEPEEVTTRFPLTHVLIVGDTPQFYYDGQGNPVGSFDENNTAPPPNIAPLIPVPSVEEDGS